MPKGRKQDNTLEKMFLEEYSFDKLKTFIDNGSHDISEAKNLSTLEKPYIDKFATKEQKKRDEFVTELLKEYVGFYKGKVSDNKRYKKVLFYVSITLLIIVSLGFGLLLWEFLVHDNLNNGIFKFVSTSVTFLSLIIGILMIITKYVFLENDEEYITKIVEMIQNNDLQNKKENIKVQSNEIYNDK